MFTDINICPINNKTDHISEKYIFYTKKKLNKSWYFPDFRSDLAPDPLFHETDPRIRIDIKIKRIRNTAKKCFKHPTSLNIRSTFNPMFNAKTFVHSWH